MLREGDRVGMKILQLSGCPYSRSPWGGAVGSQACLTWDLILIIIGPVVGSQVIGIFRGLVPGTKTSLQPTLQLLLWWNGLLEYRKWLLLIVFQRGVEGWILGIPKALGWTNKNVIKTVCAPLVSSLCYSTWFLLHWKSTWVALTWEVGGGL